MLGVILKPVSTVRKLLKVGVVITQDSGCGRSTNDGTRDTGASLLNILATQPDIARKASLVLEPLFHLLKSAKVEFRTPDKTSGEVNAESPRCGG
ncbi:MAG: hypothetical protein ACREIT_11885 [Tepidisphaeraceae bacterium]